MLRYLLDYVNGLIGSVHHISSYKALDNKCFSKADGYKKWTEIQRLPYFQQNINNIIGGFLSITSDVSGRSVWISDPKSVSKCAY